MSAVEDGGPIFPCVQQIEVPDFINTDTGEIYSWRKENVARHGMSLRDHFAGQALIAIVSKTPLFSVGYSEAGAKQVSVDERDLIMGDVAAGAYLYADAMIAARSRGAS